MTRVVVFSALLLSLTGPAIARNTVSIADAPTYAPVTLSGSVDRIIDDDTFVLADASGTIPVYIGPHAMPVTVDMVVTVTGAIDDDLPRELYAEQLILPDNRVIDVGGAYD